VICKRASYKMFVLFLALLLFSALGCGVQNLSAEQTPTRTPIPPEPSAVLPAKAPTPTPVPTSIPSTPTPDFSPIMAPVINGEGIAEAAQYDPDGLGSHRLLVLTDSGSAHEWNELLPSSWVPLSSNEIDLVVLVYPEREIELDTHAYIGGPPITRYRFETDVEVREARTGLALWEGTLKGSIPRSFPETAPVEKTRLEGDHVSFEDLEEWLSCRFVSPRECEYRLLEGHTNGVAGVAFSPDGQILASGSSDVRLWRLSDSALLRTMEESGGTVVFSPDGQILAALSEDGVRMWRVSDGTLLRTLKASKVTSIAFSPDGQILASGSWDEVIVRLWRVSDGAQLLTLEGSGRNVVFSPDGQTLASGSRDENIVRLWQVSDGTLLRVFEGHRHGVVGVAISPDGEILASASSDLYVHLWRVSDGTLLRKLFGHSNTVTSVAFSPNGQTLASGSADQTVRLWRVSDGTLLRTIELTSYVFCVAFSPDGQILAAGADDQAVHLWQIE
jgi:hypothetical protein